MRRPRCSSTSRGCGRRSSRTPCSSRARPATRSTIAPEQLDLERFRTLVERGRGELDDGDPMGAAQTLREALALWRGPPLADLANEPFAAEASRALDEERLAALEARIDADLACGRHARARRRAVGARPRDPLRERLRAQLMLALYRSGRQSEALDAYADARQTLVSELGLEPGPELQELQQAILDPGRVACALRRRPAGGGDGAGSLLVATAVGSALLAAALAALALRDDDAAGVDRAVVGEGTVVGIDAESGEIVRRIPAGRTPSALAVGDGALWLVDADARTVLRIVPSSRVVETLATGATPTDIAFGAGSVWVANGRRLQDTQFIGPVATAVAQPRSDDAHRADRDRPSDEREARRRTSSTTTSRSRRALCGRSRRTSRSFEPTRRRARSRRRFATCRQRRSPAAARGSGCSESTGRSSGSTSVRVGSYDAHPSLPVRSDRSPSAGTRPGSRPLPTERCGASVQGAPTSVGATELSPGVNDVAVTSDGNLGRESHRRNAHAGRSGDDAGHPHDRPRRHTALGRDRRRDRLGDGDPRSRCRRHVRGDGRGDLRTERVRTAAGGRERPGGLPHHLGPAAAGRRSRERDADGRRDRVRASRATLPRRRVPRRLPVLRRLDREHGPVRRGQVRVERARVRREPGRDRRRGNVQLGVRRLRPSRAESRAERPARDGVAVQRLRRPDAARPRCRSLSARGAVPDGRSQLRPRLPDGRPRGRGARPARAGSSAIARLRARRRRSRLRSAPGDGVRDSRASASGSTSWGGRHGIRERTSMRRSRVASPHREPTPCTSAASSIRMRAACFATWFAVFPTMSTSSDRAGSRPPRS